MKTSLHSDIYHRFLPDIVYCGKRSVTQQLSRRFLPKAVFTHAPYVQLVSRQYCIVPLWFIINNNTVRHPSGTENSVHIILSLVRVETKTTAAESSTEQWVKWIYFSIIWWDFSKTGQFSLQSIKSQSIRHGSLSSVDSSSFPIVQDGKSPSCLSGEGGQRCQSSEYGWLKKQRADRVPTPTFMASRSWKAGDFFGFLNLLRDSGGNFTACIWHLRQD